MVPRMLCVVERVPTGPLGESPTVSVVQSRRTKQEKKPWRDLPAIKGPVEKEFIYRLYLGESVAPFRLLEHALAVIPWDNATNCLLDAAAAGRSGYLRLASWLDKAEELWLKYGKRGRNLLDQLDYYGKLKAQFPISPVRVVYAASGTWPAAAILTDPQGVVEHSLYWARVQCKEEASYLCAILNSRRLLQMVARYQAKGQWGARHFDKLLVNFGIPKYDANNPIHQQLAEAGREAEAVARTVSLPKGVQFVRARQLIREALQASGVAVRIDGLVEELLHISESEKA